MSREHAHPDLAARLAHLRRVATKERRYLGYTAEKLQQADPQFRWLDAIEQNAELTEMMAASLE